MLTPLSRSLFEEQIGPIVVARVEGDAGGFGRRGPDFPEKDHERASMRFQDNASGRTGVNNEWRFRKKSLTGQTSIPS